MRSYEKLNKNLLLLLIWVGVLIGVYSFSRYIYKSYKMDKRRSCETLKKNLLLLLILVGVLIGVAVGFIVRPYRPSAELLMWIGLPGQLYLRLLRMLMVPLIACSVVSGTASLDPRMNGKVSLVAFTFIMTTNIAGATLGVIAFLVFQPGAGGSEYADHNLATDTVQTQDVFADLFRNIIPDNALEATFRQTQTAYRDDPERPYTAFISSQLANGSWLNVTETRYAQVMYLKKADGANVLGLLVACTFLGIGAASLKQRGKAFLEFFQSSADTVIVVLRWFLWTTPIGVISLALVAVADIADIGHVFRQLGVFVVAVVTALVVQHVVWMPALFYLVTRGNPFSFMWDMSRPWIISLASASSGLVLPEMITCCEEKRHLDPRVVRFSVPFSVALGASGSAVFIACSCLFIANLTGNSTAVSKVLVIGVLTAVSAMAIPSVPSASIVTIIMILTSLRIPVEAIALLLALEFLLDRLRTPVAVVSHTMCAAVVCHWCKHDLDRTLNRDHGGTDYHLTDLDQTVDPQSSDEAEHRPNIDIVVTDVAKQ